MSRTAVRAPAWIPPMLATLAREAPAEKGWVYERKLDGIRALAFVDHGSVRLLSRNKLTLGFGAVNDALANVGGSFVVDGEVVAFAGTKTSFQMLQRRDEHGIRLRYYVFDLLWWNGDDLRSLSLIERKRLLTEHIPTDGVVKLSRHRSGDGRALHAEACAKGWEGLIAKRADAAYVGGRSRDWLKLKCTLEQEFVIGGFTDPKGSRQGFGALLVGTYDGKDLRYAGEVGTGFTTAVLLDLNDRLRALETERSPFVDRAKRLKGIHFVRPELVCQVGFGEWTRDGRLRHPRFLGLREDKRPRDVVRERPS